MRLLVVEDNKKIRELLKQGFETDYAVDVAESGDLGSSLAHENTYDLILLDNILPGKTGIEICRELRAFGKTTPIIILSVLSDTTTKVDCLNAGADDYMVKPFSTEELMARVRALLRRPWEIQGEVLEVGDLTLDTRSHAVRRDDVEIHLTRKEFMLLEYLMKNQDIVLSRGMIMEHVWDINADPFSNTIESHILSLRKKIGDTTDKRIIQTISGCGYKITIAA